jgi:hypothetical protein
MPNASTLACQVRQVLTRQILEPAHEARKVPVGQRQLAHDARLGAEAEPQPLARHLGMALAKGGGAIAPVGLRILLVADPDHAQIEKTHHARHNPLAGQRIAGEVLLDALSHPRQQPPERNACAEFLRLARGAEVGMVAVLLAAAVVEADREDMPIGMRTEPCITVGRGKRNRIEPHALFGIGDAPAVVIEIGPALARPFARDPRHRIVDEDQAAHLR